MSVVPLVLAGNTGSMGNSPWIPAGELLLWKNTLPVLTPILHPQGTGSLNPLI